MGMEQFDKDVLHWEEYDYVVINEDLDTCCKEIIGYLEEKIKYKRSVIENHIKKLI